MPAKENPRFTNLYITGVTHGIFPNLTMEDKLVTVAIFMSGHILMGFLLSTPSSSYPNRNRYKSNFLFSINFTTDDVASWSATNEPRLSQSASNVHVQNPFTTGQTDQISHLL